MSNLPPSPPSVPLKPPPASGSFTQAAEELGLTQAAISYQVKQLEDRVGSPLFLRQARKVVLSEAGKRLAPAVADAFQRLTLAFDALRNSDENVLSLTAVSTFCTNWLVPRLGTFQMAHPDIAVRLDACRRAGSISRARNSISASAAGRANGRASPRISCCSWNSVSLPVRNSSRAGQIATPPISLRLPLLDWTDNAWRLWFKTAGISDPQPSSGPNIMAPTQQILRRSRRWPGRVSRCSPRLSSAARSQPGGWCRFCLSRRASRSITGSSYPEERRNRRKVRAFREWLLGQVQADGLLPDDSNA